MISPDKRSNLMIESAIWIDSVGNIYFIRSNLVRKYEASEGSSKIISLQISEDEGEQSNYSLWGDSVGRLYIADSSNHLIRTLNLNDPTAPLVTVAGNGDATMPENGAVATSTGIGFPSQIWVNVEGHFFFADYEACNVYEVNEEGRIYKILGTGSYGGELRLGSSSVLTQIGCPVGIVGDVLGNVYVAANSGHGVIYKLSERSVKYDYKVEYYAGVRGVYSLQGSYGNGNGDGDGLLATSTHFTYIGSIDIDSHSNIYVEDGGSKVIRKIDGVSGATRIVVSKEVNNQGDCSSGNDDDGPYLAHRIFVNEDGGIYIFRCSLINFIAPTIIETHSSHSQSLHSIFFNNQLYYLLIFASVAFILLTRYRKYFFYFQ